MNTLLLKWLLFIALLVAGMSKEIPSNALRFISKTPRARKQFKVIRIVKAEPTTTPSYREYIDSSPKEVPDYDSVDLMPEEADSQYSDNAHTEEAPFSEDNEYNFYEDVPNLSSNEYTDKNTEAAPRTNSSEYYNDNPNDEFVYPNGDVAPTVTSSSEHNDDVLEVHPKLEPIPTIRQRSSASRNPPGTFGGGYEFRGAPPPEFFRFDGYDRQAVLNTDSRQQAVSKLPFKMPKYPGIPNPVPALDLAGLLGDSQGIISALERGRKNIDALPDHLFQRETWKNILSGVISQLKGEN